MLCGCPTWLTMAVLTQTKACSETLDPSSCKDKCEWNADFALCWPTDLDIPCE